MIPPQFLLASGWLPFILNFYWKAVSVFFRFPGQVAVTSWFRNVPMNRDAGGDEDSQHLFALAWDIAAAPELLQAVASVARQAGLIAVVEPDHVHIQAFPAGALARAGVQFPR